MRNSPTVSQLFRCTCRSEPRQRAIENPPFWHKKRLPKSSGSPTGGEYETQTFQPVSPTPAWVLQKSPRQNPIQNPVTGVSRIAFSTSDVTDPSQQPQRGPVQHALATVLLQGHPNAGELLVPLDRILLLDRLGHDAVVQRIPFGLEHREHRTAAVQPSIAQIQRRVGEQFGTAARITDRIGKIGSDRVGLGTSRKHGTLDHHDGPGVNAHQRGQHEPLGGDAPVVRQ